ncbi:MAG: glyoxalase superfamily protein [Alteraurantiacibacter sp.]
MEHGGSRGQVASCAHGFVAGREVQGRYFGQIFAGRIGASTQMDDGQVYLMIDLAEPIDVIVSENFSSMRRRISGMVDADGVSAAVLSSGMPQIVLGAM